MRTDDLVILSKLIERLIILRGGFRLTLVIINHTTCVILIGLMERGDILDWLEIVRLWLIRFGKFILLWLRRLLLEIGLDIRIHIESTCIIHLMLLMTLIFQTQRRIYLLRSTSSWILALSSRLSLLLIRGSLILKINWLMNKFTSSSVLLLILTWTILIVIFGILWVSHS